MSDDHQALSFLLSLERRNSRLPQCPLITGRLMKTPVHSSNGKRTLSLLGFIHWLDKERKAEEASLKSHSEKRREMLNLPKTIIQVLRYFEDAFSERVWEWAKVLLIGAILAPGERTVTAILRVMGLHNEQQFQ